MAAPGSHDHCVAICPTLAHDRGMRASRCWGYRSCALWVADVVVLSKTHLETVGLGMETSGLSIRKRRANMQALDGALGHLQLVAIDIVGACAPR